MRSKTALTGELGVFDGTSANRVFSPSNAQNGVIAIPLLWIAGQWYSPSLLSTTSSITPVAGRLQMYPFRMPGSRNIDTLGFNVTTAGAAGNTAEAGIWRANTSTNLPSTFVGGTGALSTTTTGAKTAAMVQTLAPGVYWVGLAASSGSTAVVTGLTNSGIPIFAGSTTMTNPGANGISVDSKVPGSLTADLTGTVWNYVSSATQPAVWFKAA